VAAAFSPGAKSWDDLRVQDATILGASTPYGRFKLGERYDMVHHYNPICFAPALCIRRGLLFRIPCWSSSEMTSEGLSVDV
jgi:hypothetical protein